MRSPSRSDLVVALAAVGGAAALWVSQPGFGWGEFVFVSCLLFILLVGLRMVWRSWARASAEQRVARTIARTSPTDAARRLLQEESERMSADIRGTLRTALDDMAVAVARARESAPGDPRGVEHVRAIQRYGRLATTELRRMLGLLRPSEHLDRAGVRASTGPTASTGSTGSTDADAEPLGRRRLPGLGAAALAVVLLAEIVFTVLGASDEHGVIGGAGPSGGWTVLQIVLTGIAALLFLTPLDVAVASACTAVVFVLGLVIDVPVASGLWMIVTLGVLAWRSVARPARRPWGYLALVALFGAVNVSQWLTSRDNVAIADAILVVGVITGLATHVGERVHASARERAVHAERALAEATERVVRQTRLTAAHDLHDALSGTVGVIIAQAGAAEVQWERRPDRARSALGIVEVAVEHARRDLDLMIPDAAPSLDAPPEQELGTPPDLEDVPALVARMRAAGIKAELRAPTAYPPGAAGATGSAVYRNIQECLSNVARHAPAARVDIALTVADGVLAVVVADDGPGLPDAQLGGYGLTGLRERVALLGGSVSIDSEPTGLRIESRVPIRQEAGT